MIGLFKLKAMRVLFFVYFKLLAIILYGQSGIVTVELRPGGIESKDAMNNSLVVNGIDNANTESISVMTWTNGGNLVSTRGFISFDLTFIPPNSEIISAFLSLYYNYSEKIQSIDEHFGSNEMFIERLLGPWKEDSINWINQPSTTTENRVFTPASSSGTQNMENINVTNLIQDILYSQEGNHGMRLRMVDETNPYRALILASSEHPDPLVHPKLVVQYRTIISGNLVKVENAEIFVKTPAQGVVLTSPNGNCWKLVIDDSGVLHSYLISCPE